MKTLKNKMLALTITMFFLLSTIASTVLIPNANAHTPPLNITTWCFCYVENSVIGVGQNQLIIFWSNAVPPTATGEYGDRWSFSVNITDPNGKLYLLGPFSSDPVGGSFANYIPTEVGKYTVVVTMAEHLITGLPLAPPSASQNLVYINDTFLSSTSNPTTFTVQQEAIASWTEAPLPTDYWTFPINEVNRDWYVLAGNWLAGTSTTIGSTGTVRFCYGTGPESAHVMWASPLWTGGIADTRQSEIGYTTGHYEGTTLTPPIILDGKIYYNVASLPKEGWYCLNLYTGKTEFFVNTTGAVTGVSQSSSGSIAGGSLAFGQVLNIENPNQHGCFAYLWSTTAPSPLTNTWAMFDAFTGNYMCSIGNVTQQERTPDGRTVTTGATGTQVFGTDGSICYYNIVNLGTTANPKMYLQCWNTTQAIWWRGNQAQFFNNDYSAFLSNDYWMWRPGLNVTYDGTVGFTLNASIPAVQGSIFSGLQGGAAISPDQYVIGGIAGKNNGTYVQKGNLWALNLDPTKGTLGSLLWNITFTPPLQIADDFSAALNSAGTVSLGIVDAQDGVFEFEEKGTLQRWGYSIATGQQIWGPTTPEPALNYYSSVMPNTGLGITNVYKGMLLSTGFGGVMIAYNITTGQVLWNYTAPNIGSESPYGNYPISICCIADGKLYLVSGEHSVSEPMWRGGCLRCVNASNGVELWTILQFGADGGANLAGWYVAIGNGYVVGLNQYDGQLYCYGKGPSATTVAAPLNGITAGSSFTITGTVTDTCSGAIAVAPKFGYTNGVPAVSDESQQPWMEYLYEQQTKPNNVTGVPVTIDVVDPNGNFVNLGTATSDLSGVYGLTVDTNKLAAGPGTYRVIASFAATKSYGSSSAESFFTVNAASIAAPTAIPQQGLATTADLLMYIVVGVIAIIIVVAIVGALIMLSLRKRL